MEGEIGVTISDLRKIMDILMENQKFHKSRDEMNSVLHLARETRYSPLTTETIAAVERLEKILGVRGG